MPIIFVLHVLKLHTCNNCFLSKWNMSCTLKKNALQRRYFQSSPQFSLFLKYFEFLFIFFSGIITLTCLCVWVNGILLFAASEITTFRENIYLPLKINIKRHLSFLKPKIKVAYWKIAVFYSTMPQRQDFCEPFVNSEFISFLPFYFFED